MNNKHRILQLYSPDSLICETCFYWKKDYGIWCINGWSGADRNDGHCHHEPKKIYKSAEDFCSKWETKEKEKQ